MTRTTVGVLVKRFPKLSETFILNEVIGLEARGQKLHIFALEAPTDEIVNPAVGRVQARVEHVTAATLFVWLQVFVSSPVHFARGIWTALREFGLRDGRAISQAMQLARLMRLGKIGHLHAHFADRPAAIARTACALAGLSFSISAHAKDIYVQAPDRLRPRLRAANFTATCTGHNAIHLRKLEPSARVVRLYHGVDTATLSADPSRPRTGAPLILGVGRLRPKKGFDTLITACAQLAKDGHDFRCVIAGYGPEEAPLRASIKAANLAGRIELAGKIPHEEVVALMRAASIFALPCRVEEDGDRDGIPNVLLEAMTVGVPVVSTSVSGIPELITNGETGLLAPPNDAPALADAMSQVLHDNALAVRLAANARRVVNDRFSLDGDIAVLNRLLTQALRREEGGGRVGYILKGFPRLSESFISNEIRLLESNGLPMHIFAIKHGDEMGEQVLSEISTPITYLPKMTSLSGTAPARWFVQNLPDYAGGCARLLVRRPISFARTLFRAFEMSDRYRDPKTGARRYVFLKEFLQSAYIADQALRVGGIAHFHGHFCHGATTVTQLVGGLLGNPFSFTAHAKDIYEQKLNPGDLLQRKFAEARFAVTCTGANHQHLESRGVDCCKLHTIYHGLDTTLFSPASSSFASRAPLVLAVGRYVEKKGFLDLIAACAQLKKRGVEFQACIVGEEGEAGPAMRAMIVREGLSDTVTLAPPAPQRALRDIYARATLFALPCRITDSGDRDGIPNVLAEAMAMELPVVTTDVSGIPELVHHRRTGLLVPPADVSALASAMEEVLTSTPEDRLTLGRAARAIIEERFDSRKTTLSLKGLFDRSLLEAAT